MFAFNLKGDQAKKIKKQELKKPFNAMTLSNTTWNELYLLHESIKTCLQNELKTMISIMEMKRATV